MSGKENSSGKKFAKGGATCLQCGDLGYDIALIFCNKCKEFAIHRYCLDRLPKTLAEYVVWCCDDCRPPKVEKPLYDEQPSSSMSEKKDSLDSKVIQPVEPKSKSKKRKSFDKLQKRRVQRKRKKKQQQRDKEKAAAVVAATEIETIGKTREDVTLTAVDEKFRENGGNAPVITDGDEELKKEGGTTSNIIDEIPGTMEHDKGQNKRCELDSVLEKERISKEDERQQRDKEKVTAVVEVTERETIGKTRQDLALTATDEKLKENGGSAPIITDGDEEHKEGGTTSDITDEIPCSMEHDKGRNNRCELDSVLEKEIISKEDVQPTKTSLVPAPVYLDALCSPTEQARPFIDPVWRGSISINNLALSCVNKIVAHVSTLATSKVVEEAELFPQLLCCDLHPRTSVWPKSFEKWGPTDESIALFFFPENERNDKVFESLLSEMIRGDFALKAVVKYAELLVFTSTKLPLHLWKFRGKFFLWGVFMAKQLPSDSSNAAIARSEDIAVEGVNWRKILL